MKKELVIYEISKKKIHISSQDVFLKWFFPILEASGDFVVLGEL